MSTAFFELAWEG